MTVLFVGIGVTLFSSVAQAAISLRASSTGTAGSPIVLRGTNIADNGTGTFALALAMPTGTVENDVIVAAVTVRGGNGVTITKPDISWTQLDSQDGSTTTLKQAVFWKKAGPGESGSYSWGFSASSKATGVIMSYGNTATSSPIDVSGGQYNAASTTITAPSVTTTVANDMLVGFFGYANTGSVTSGAMTVQATATSGGGGSAGTKATTGGADLQLGAAGATGTKTATGTSAINIGQLVAIKPLPATSLSLAMPTGTVQDDVMIAAISITGGSGVTFTPPSGWTSIIGTNVSTTMRTEVWWKRAGVSEAGPYSWSWTGSQSASGVIMSYRGVDTGVSPIENSTSGTTGGSTIVSTGGFTTTNIDKLVGIFSFSNNSAITSTMTDEAYTSTSGTTNTAIRAADTTMTAAGSTGSFSGTAGTAGSGIGQLIALTPAIATLSQDSGRWYDQPQVGINWAPRNAPAGTWLSITYNNGLFVAVGNASDRIMTSPDGVTWTVRTPAANNDWDAVTYGNGLFVAVANSGTGNRVMTSPDGITWTSRTSAADNLWFGITYGNGLFVAVSTNGTGNRVMTSPDGITWTSRTSAADVAWNSITYNNSLFVAVGNSAIMTSPDGITWTSRTEIGGGHQWSSVISGNGTFVAVDSNSFNGTYAMASAPVEATAATWKLRSSGNSEGINAMTYANGQFVAVGSTTTLTSPDGINWTSKAAPAGNCWDAIGYGNGVYVAVGECGGGNNAMHSTDGVNWTLSSGVGSNDWKSVTYGNGMFVAVACSISTNGCASATGQRVMTSPDGITWTMRGSATDTLFWLSVIYSKGLFVAVSISGTGNRVMTSPDGITWTSRTSAADNQWDSVTYGNGLFVAVASDGTGNRVMTSPDGIIWTSRTSTADIGWLSVAYGNGLFVAVALSGTGNRVMTSPDGITWTSRTSAADNSWHTVAYGNGMFVAGAIFTTGTSDIMTAPGIDASVGSPLAAQNTASNAIASDNVRLRMNLGVSNNPWTAGNTSQKKLALQYATRTDNVCSGSETYYDVGTSAWTAQTSASDIFWTSVTYGNGLFVAVSNSGVTNNVMTSPDGINWTIRAGATTNAWNSVTYGNGLFVAVSSDGTGNRVMTSPDGVTWTSQTSAANNSWTSATYGNGVFVAVAAGGASNFVMTSSDGFTWTSHASATTNQWLSVTYGNGQFVAVANSGTGNRVMTSSDGSTWTSQTSAANNTWQSVTYGNGQFVAVAGSGSGNRVMTSPDGVTWTSRTSAADDSWDGITYANGLFVAVANDGISNSVMTSPDGINWSIRTAVTTNAWRSVVSANSLFVAVGSTGTGNRVMTMSPPVNWGGQTANNYGTVTASGNDPTAAGTIRNQFYVSNNYFTNQIDAATGESGQFDFDLDLSKATYNSSYCFRVVNYDGTALNSYSSYPLITRCSSPPPLSQRTRYGQAICGGGKRFYWGRATS